MIQRMLCRRAASFEAEGEASAASSRSGQAAMAKGNRRKRTEFRNELDSGEIASHTPRALRLESGMAGMLSRQGRASSLRQTTAALTIHFHQAGGFAFG